MPWPVGRQRCHWLKVIAETQVYFRACLGILKQAVTFIYEGR